MPEHYNCGGELVASEAGIEYTCRKCGNSLEQSVVKRHGNFRRVAERGGPASEIARVALEGY